jgi:putative endonuclease
MYTVYVLQSDDKRLYKGFTNNLDRRLEEHKNKTVKTTRNFINIQVIYTEQCQDRISARKREKYLKSSAGRRYLKNILQS